MQKKKPVKKKPHKPSANTQKLLDQTEGFKKTKPPKAKKKVRSHKSMGY